MQPDALSLTESSQLLLEVYNFKQFGIKCTQQASGL